MIYVGWGGVGWRSLRDVHAVDATLPMGWGGVGWDVDVRCKMYTLWMLRCRWGGVGWGGVGCCRSLQDVHAVDATLPMGLGGVGMLTFAARCTRCGCYVADGVLKPTESVQDASVEGLVNKSELPSLQPV